VKPTPRPPTAPTDMMPQQPRLPTTPPTTVVPTADLSLADGTGAVHDIPTESALRPKRGTLLALLALAMLAVVGGVYAMTRPSGSGASSAAARGSAAPHPTTITVAPIPAAEQQPPSGSASTAVAVAAIGSDAIDPGVQVDPTPKPDPHKKPDATAHVRHHPDHRVIETPKHTEPLTRDAVAAKLRAVKHDYDAYKAKNGGRLDDQWNDLAQFINFQLRTDNLDEASRRIDAFKARMKAE
jgi:hypothetical protein